METQTEPTLETQVNGHPFLVTGDEQSLIDMAEQLRYQQQRELAMHIGKQALIFPLRVVGGLGTLVARSVAHSVNEHRIMLYDRLNGTDFHDQLEAKRKAEKDYRMTQRLGLVTTDHLCRKHP